MLDKEELVPNSNGAQVVEQPPTAPSESDPPDLERTSNGKRSSDNLTPTPGVTTSAPQTIAVKCTSRHKRRRVDPNPLPASAPLPGAGTAEPAPAGCVCGSGARHACRAVAGRPVADGELLFVQERYTRVFQARVRSGGVLETRYGTFLHDALLGRAAGRRWAAARHAREGRAQCGGFMHAVRPGPVLWGASVAHRTQIVHAPDAALILLRLGVGSGDVVVEAGAGSAALSAQFAWAVAPAGAVRSFEFHAARAAAARDAVTAAGFAGVASVTTADVVADGFVGVPDASVDAVFLDLPAPEHVLAEAARVLRAGKSVCCFSPCVEQVLRTCDAARRSGRFHSLVTVTAPVRTYETRAAAAGGGGAGLLAAPRARERGAGEAEERAVAERHFGRVLRDTRGVLSRPFSEMKGHTSFLTFATRAGRGAEARGSGTNGGSGARNGASGEDTEGALGGCALM